MSSAGRRDAWQDERPAPSWLGDVAAGVEAWTQGRSTEPQAPLDQQGGSEAAPRPARRSSRSGSAGSRRGAGRSSGGARRATPPPDAAALGPDADPESVARTILLEQLTGRARSRKELADKLAAKLVPDDVATRLLDRFEEVGLIDDEAFARLWVSSRGAGSSRGLAGRALSQELRRKGVDDQVVREVLDDVEPDAERDAARALAERRLRSLSRVDDVTATRRLVGMLARKGYPAGLCHQVVREVLAAADREPPEEL